MSAGDGSAGDGSVLDGPTPDTPQAGGPTSGTSGDVHLTVGERRPIRARNAAVFNALAARLAAGGVSPNGISIAGMVSGVAAGGALAATAWLEPGWTRVAWFLAAVCIPLRLIANLLDGMVAIESGKASPVGELFNEVPDRISDVCIFVGAGYAAGGHPVLGFLAAIVAVLVAYVRAAAKVAGAAQDYCGPQAKAHRMALLTAVAAYCGLSPVGWQSFPVAGHGVGVPAAALGVVILGGAWTFARRLRRAARRLHEGSP